MSFEQEQKVLGNSSEHINTEESEMVRSTPNTIDFLAGIVVGVIVFSAANLVPEPLIMSVEEHYLVFACAMVLLTAGSATTGAYVSHKLRQSRYSI